MVEVDRLAALRESHLFASLDAGEMDQVLACAEEKQASKGDLLFLDGEEAARFYVVISGAVKIYKTSRDAKELILNISEAGDSFAEAAVFAGKDYPASAETLTDARLLSFRKDRFRQLLMRHPNIGLKIIGSLSLKLRFLVRLIEDLTLKDVEERLASALLDACEKKSGSSVDIEFSKKILAAKLGTIPETLSRTLRKLKEAEMIEVDGPSIRVLRPDLLRDLIGSRPR